MDIPLIHAIDLIIEDLSTKHHEIRSQSSILGCNKEVDLVRDKLISHLYDMKKTVEENGNLL